MEFSPNRPIFKQIAEMICHKIIDGTYQPGARIPSVRDLAATVKVNPNTVVNTFSELTAENIIVNQRGIGFECTADCKENATKYLERVLIHGELEMLLKTLKNIGMTEEQLLSLFKKL